MNKKEKKGVPIFAVVLIALIVCGITWNIALGGSLFAVAQNTQRTEKYKQMDQILDIINEKYYSQYNEEDLFKGAYEGIVNALNDPYSEYIDEEELNSILEFNEGTFCGIGITYDIDKEKNYPVVRGIVDGSPAKDVGMMIGDLIVAVDDKDIKGFKNNEVVAVVTGPKDSNVKVTVDRNGQKIDFNIVRKEIDSQIIEGKLIDGDVGLVSFKSYSGNSAKKTIQEFEKLKEKGAKYFILDLRDNGGGILEEAVNICDYFMPEGQIIYTENKDGEGTEYLSEGDGFGLPLVVLTNENSASASEVTAGALQNAGVAKVVGKKTFGKGVVQKFYNIDTKNSALKLTTDKYFLANGKSPDGDGILPDVEVDLPADMKSGKIPYSIEGDTQLKKAIEVLKK